MRQLKNEIIVDFSSGGFVDEPTARDGVPGEKLYVSYEGKNYPVRSLELYEKLIQLPYAQLEVLILKYWCCHTDQQIADIIGVSARTVRNRRSRALNELRMRWKGG